MQYECNKIKEHNKKDMINMINREGSNSGRGGSGIPCHALFVVLKWCAMSTTYLYSHHTIAFKGTITRETPRSFMGWVL